MDTSSSNRANRIAHNRDHVIPVCLNDGLPSHSAASDDAATPSGARPEVRRALLDATGALVQRHGYRKTSVEDIARQAGVSRATAYLYFANKEELVLGWIAQRDQERLTGLRDLIRDDNKSATERAEAFLLARILTRFDSAQPYTESIDELLAALRPRVLAERDRLHETEAALLAGVLQGGVAEGEFAPFADPLATARLLLLGTNALLPYSLTARQLGERVEVESRARGLIALLMGGLAASATHGDEIKR